MCIYKVVRSASFYFSMLFFMMAAVESFRLSSKKKIMLYSAAFSILFFAWMTMPSISDAVSEGSRLGHVLSPFGLYLLGLVKTVLLAAATITGFIALSYCAYKGSPIEKKIVAVSSLVVVVISAIPSENVYMALMDPSFA